MSYGRILVALVGFAGCSLGGDKNRCETQADCLDGFTCSATGTCEPMMSTCTPAECAGRCGELADPCGGTLECGACPEHCSNGTRDPSETDTDCGGDCSPCAQGGQCKTTLDCQTGTCDAGTCRAGTWSSGPQPMPTPRADFAAVVGADGMIYAIGGSSPGGTTGAVEMYDPSHDSWTTRAPMPTPRYGLAAVVGADGTIYAIGGNYTSVTNAGPSIKVEAYNPATNMWQALPSLPVGRSDVAAAFDAGSGTVLALGGFDGVGFQTLGSVAAWQPGAPSWSVLPDALTTSRSEHAAAVIDGDIYVLGGDHDVAGNELAAFEYYHPGTSGWHTLTAMPTPRRLLAAASIGTRLYAIGGGRWVGAGIPYTSVVEMFDTAAHTWSQVTSLPIARREHAAVSLGGKIYVLGGHAQDTDSITGTIAVYTPDP